MVNIFGSKSKGKLSPRLYSIQFEWNIIVVNSFDSKSRGKLSSRLYSVQFERRWKSVSASVAYTKKIAMAYFAATK